MTQDKLKKILIGVGALVVIGIAFQYLGSSGNGGALTSGTQGADTADARMINSLLQKMAQVRLDRSIFDDPKFKNLKDNTVFFSPQPYGRPNPFAPIGVDSVGTVSTSSAKSSTKK